MQSVFTLYQLYSQNLLKLLSSLSSPSFSPFLPPPLLDKVVFLIVHLFHFASSYWAQAVCFDLLCLGLIIFVSPPCSLVPSTEQKLKKCGLNAHINE